MSKEQIRRLLCDILREICDAIDETDTYESKLRCHTLPQFRYAPILEFTEEDIKLIKEISTLEGEDFSKLTD